MPHLAPGTIRHHCGAVCGEARCFAGPDRRWEPAALGAQPEGDEGRHQTKRDEDSSGHAFAPAVAKGQLGSPPHEDQEPRQDAGEDQISHEAEHAAAPLRTDCG